MKILALDPGKMTGAVIIDWGGELPPEPQLMLSDQVPFEEMPHWLDGHLVPERCDLLVMERFIISERTIRSTRQMEALYTIGGGLFLADLRGIPVRMQSASDAKSAYDNDYLKRWKLLGRHAKDAMRHALLACHGRGVYTPVCKETTDTGD